MWKIGEGRRPSAVLTIGAAVLVIAGCGGSGSSQPSASATAEAPAANTTPSLPANAELITKAEAICSRLNKAIAPATPGRLDPREIAAGAPANAALERTAVRELSRLKAPAKMAADWRKIIAYRRTLAAELSKLARAAKAGDTAGITALAASKKRMHQQLSALATRDGFKACARIG
jgi:hypothetical protein